MFHFESFLNLVFIGFVSLFPPVNPLGTALLLDPFFHHLSYQDRQKAAKKIALYCLAIGVATVIAGSWIFKLFSISIPVVQIAGGILICKMGWELLSTESPVKKSEGPNGRSEADKDKEDIEELLFYPLAFPMTVGPGSISVLLTLSAHGHSNHWPTYFMNLSAIILAVVLMAVLIYFSFAFSPKLIKRFGPRGSLVVNRLTAFLVFCVGLQIMSTGIMHFIK
ncbi:MAG: MarC family protein [Candidatus Saccharicenans sp.]